MPFFSHATTKMTKGTMVSFDKKMHLLTNRNFAAPCQEGSSNGNGYDDHS